MKSKLFLIGAVLSLLLWGTTAHAERLQFTPTVQTATATTSPVYQTPGTATTTITFDSYSAAGGAQIAAIDLGVLLGQFTGSSTATTWNISEEVSQDGIDWYADNTFITTNASTTQSYFINTPIGYKLPFASSTPDGGNVPANNNLILRAIHLNFPTRFVRVFVSLSLGGTNGGFWGQIIPERQKD